MSTIYNEFDQGTGPAMLWPFRIFHIFGKPGQIMIVKVDRPMERARYYNSVNIVRGHIDCEQPDGKVVRWEAGMCDLELPAYPTAGGYKLHPGPDGVEFFCASACCPRFATRTLCRRLIMPHEGESMFPAGQMLILVSGEMELDGEVSRAPVIVQPKAEPIYPTFRGAHGVALWLD